MGGPGFVFKAAGHRATSLDGRWRSPVLTLAFVDAPYFRKLFSPLVEGSVGTE